MDSLRLYSALERLVDRRVDLVAPLLVEVDNFLGTAGNALGLYKHERQRSGCGFLLRWI